MIGFPSVENIPFDYFVWNGKDKHLIQVKSTSKLEKDYNSYKFNVRKGGNNKQVLTEKDCDFVVLFVMPKDLFYIIPISLIDNQTLRVYPEKASCKWNQYKNRWELLKCDQKSS